MPASDSKDDGEPLGHAWLRREFGLSVPEPAVESYLIPGARRTEIHGRRAIEFYPRPYAPGPSLPAQLRFALRYEPLDLGIMVAALKALDRSKLEAWIRAEPTGSYSRRAWFLYETFTGDTLDVDDARAGNYVPVLDPGRHVVAQRRNSFRHRVIDNLLGGPGYCPTVRRTARLQAQMRQNLDEEARSLIRHHDPAVLARAVNYLYTKETRSSFAIEGETPSTGKADRFAAALKDAPNFDPTSELAIVRLQGDIVDPRYAAKGWRDFQNFVGETVGGFREEVHFICPRPEDVPALMDGWMQHLARVVDDAVDPVVAAATVAFGFVFIHPFEDGNGRIHRFLMHHVLARRSFSPRGVIFPVSAAILRDRRSYDEILATFSKPLLDAIDWHLTADREVSVRNETADLYRYFDATLFAEYLYDRVADTIRQDLKQELDFVAVFDRAFDAVRAIVDMPDRRASLFVRLCLQNGGQLSQAKRTQFGELTEVEIAAMEAAVQAASISQDS